MAGTAGSGRSGRQLREADRRMMTVVPPTVQLQEELHDRKAEASAYVSLTCVDCQPADTQHRNSFELPPAADPKRQLRASCASAGISHWREYAGKQIKQSTDSPAGRPFRWLTH